MPYNPADDIDDDPDIRPEYIDPDLPSCDGIPCIDPTQFDDGKLMLTLEVAEIIERHCDRAKGVHAFDLAMKYLRERGFYND